MSRLDYPVKLENWRATPHFLRMSGASLGHPLFCAAKDNTNLCERCEREIDIQLSPQLTVSLSTIVDDTLDSGGSIWNGGYYLSKYLLHHADMVRNKTVLELGSGCGLTGIVAGVCKAKHVVLTDLPEQIPYLQSNIDKNRDILQSEACTCMPLEWGTEAKHLNIHQYDAILAADVGFDISLHHPLVSTLLLYASATTDIYLVEEQRWKDVYNWYLEEISEHFYVIDKEVISSDACRAPVVLWHVKKK